MKLPVYNLLYFKNILDIAFIKFFDEYNSCFRKEHDVYVLQKDISLNQLEKIFDQTVRNILTQIVKPYDPVNSPEVYFIIGACQPKDNFLLNFKDGYFPNKLLRLIDSEYQLKYILKEKDIMIDFIKFNEACKNVFNKYFSLDNKTKYQNVIFITHHCLDCYSMFKTIKCIFGQRNCRNLYIENFQEIKSPIIAVNDLIDRYVNNKKAANKDKRFKSMYLEIKQFIMLKIQNLNERN